MRKVYFFLVMLGLVFGMNLNLQAQISYGGIPASTKFTGEVDDNIDAITITPINVAQVRLEDSMRSGPLWSGRTIPVNVNMENAGTWSTMPDGSAIWRLKISSAGAKAIGVNYDKFYIPVGGQLFLYNASKTQVIGSYTHENNTESGIFSTELIQGESVTLEYIAPLKLTNKVPPTDLQERGYLDGNRIVTQSLSSTVTLSQPQISISEIIYVYRDVPFLAKFDPLRAPQFGASGSCQVNVNCTEGASWQAQKKGVAEIYIKNGTSYGFCSGSLVNTTNNSGTPYFLTADHCHGTPNSSPAEPYASAADMALWQFYFKYESSTCSVGANPSYSTLVGCTLKAMSPIDGGSDFCLVLLNSTPPISYNPYYVGWDRTNTAATSGVGIHHPAGDVKKISTFTSAATTGTFNGGTGLTCATGVHWNVTFVSTPNGHSVTEGGSSGSPLFNQAGRCVGTLSGGSSSCTTPAGANLYGKFYYHWDQMGTLASARLKPWLDPGNTGATTVNGYDPTGYPDFAGNPTTIYEGQTVNFTDITNGATTWSWVFEGGTPATSTVQNPSNIYYYQQGVYKVKLTTSTPLAGTQTTEKVAYITVLPGTPPVSIWCDNFTTTTNWTTSTSGGYPDSWVITSAAPTGSSTSTFGRINSSSMGNYALFDSDALGATGDNEWAHITTTNGIDCSAYGAVTLTFQDYYAKFVDSTLVYVSSDNFVTSKRYVVHPDAANNDLSENPVTQTFDISAAAAGKTNVKIRFTFRSTQDMSTSAGYAYAWMVDDVCLSGVAHGNSLPVPDFTATTSRDISPGQSVSFQDLSQLATSWLWTFEGGTPATSTTQNPTGIVYNTGGYHDVTLTATNQNGSISTTKSYYVHVFDDCSYDDSNIQPNDGFTYYGAPGTYWGYIPGHNGEGITAYADRVEVGNLTGKVKSFIVAVAKADSMQGLTDVTFRIWTDNAGVPGTSLLAQPVKVHTLKAGYLNTINFAPVSVGSSFFVGFTIDYPSNVDTFACYLANGDASRTNTAFVYNGTTWQSFEAKYGSNSSLYILPEFCLDQAASHLPNTDFFASQTEITPGTTISYTDQTTGGPAPTAWSWALTSGTPATSTVQNPPTVTYNTTGIFDASLTATNANGSDAELKGGYIHVAPISSIVYWNFPVASADITADGGITANLTKTLSVSSTVTAPTFATTGASTRCATSTGWDDALTSNDYWIVEFTTTGYTNIKFSSKQMGGATTSPRDFSVYYSADGGNNFGFLCDVPAMTTAGSWTQGVLSNVHLPADCNNQASVMLLWLKTSIVSLNGGTVAVGSATSIDDIMVTGQVCAGTPAAAGTITGPATVCQGQTGVAYSVASVAGATIYNWNLPVGATIASGAYTNSITVDFAQNQAAGNITVQTENLCGLGTMSAAKAITCNPVPVAPGTITGIQSVANGQNGVAYSVTAVPTATSYTWTVPGFATITSGATSNTISVNYACPGDFGNISVHATNGCGAGPESYAKTIAISCPPTANFFASTVQTCPGNSVTFTDISTNNPTSWSWSFPGGTPSTSTVEHPTVTYSTAGVYSVTLTVTNATGSDAETKTNYITIANPGITFTNVNENPAGACNGSSTANGSGASPFTYSWGFIDSTHIFNGLTTSVEASTNVILNNGTRNFNATVSGVGNLDGVTYYLDQVCMYITEARDQDLVLTAVSPQGQSVILVAQNVITGANLGNGTTQVCFTQAAASAIGSGTVVAPYIASPGPLWKPSGAATLNTFNTGQSPNGTWKLRIQDAAAAGGNGVLNSWTLKFNSHISNSVQTLTNLCSGNYTVTVTDASGCTSSQTTTITAAVPVSATISASTNVSCFGGNNGSATVSASGGTSPYTYDWAPNGFTGDGTVTYSALTAGTYTVTVTDALSGTATTSIIITAPAQLTATISAKTNATCAASNNGSATVTAGGGTSPYTYDWAPNGYTGDGTITYSALIPGTYTVTISDNKSCTATTSTTITAANADAPVSVSIAAVPAGAICAGTSVTFTATPTNPGTTPTYQWRVNGVAVGTNSTTYTSTTLAQGNVVTCQLTSNATCATGSPATSNSITMTVNAVPTVSATATPTTICNGSSSSLAGTGATTYAWMPGSLSGTPVSVSPTTTTTYTVTGTTSGCTGSNTVTVTVNLTAAVSVSIAAVPVGAICSGTSVTFTATPTNGGAAPTYSWRVNGTAVGTGTTYTSTTLATSDIVTCVLTSNVTCPTGNPATSNAITMTVNPNLPASVSIAAVPSGAICSGTSVTFTATPTNGGTTPTYSWRVNGTAVGTGTTYTSTTLSSSDIVTCVMTSNATCATGSPATSNAITMTVNPNLPASVSIAAVPAGAICTGTSVTFAASPTNGGTTPTYSWRVNGTAVGTGTTYTSTTLANSDIVTCVMTSNATCATGSPATSNAITMTVNSTLPASVSIAAVPAGAICSGTSVTFTATPTNGGTTPTYSWRVNGTAVGTGATYTSTTLATSDVVTCVMTSNAGCATGSPATSNAITMTVNPNLPASVTIAAVPTGAICSGTSVTFTATPTNGGTTPTYSWRVNGTAVGTGNTYTSTTLANTNVVTCVMTSNATCATGSPATSNAITMTVNPNLPASVSIAAVPAGAICSGTSVTFTATPTNGGTTPTYSWRVNGTAVGTGSTYTSTTLASSDIVTCVMTSNATCATGSPATSNAITMTVNPNLPASVSIAAVPAGAICTGTSVTFTASPTNGGTTPTYSWRVNGTAVGTGTTYTSTTLANSDIVTCVMTSNATCATGSPATSNAITMTVNSTLPASVSIAAVPAGAICSGTSVTFTATPTNGGTTPTYSWRVNGTAVGTGATYTSTTLATSDVVTCVMTSNAGCATGSPATSNAITMTVNPNLPASVTIAAVPAGAICSGTSVTFTATPTNGGTTPTYSWRVNGTAVGTGTTYTSTTLANSDIVTCIMTSNATCATGSPATSNAITMTVNPNLPASVTIAAVPAGAICSGTSVTFTATPTNGGTTPTYSWRVNGTAVGTGTTYTSTTLASSDIVTCVMTSNASCATGSPATSNAITMTVNPNLPASVTIAGVPAGAICSGTSVTFTATPTNGGTTPTYSWRVNGTAVGTGSTYTSTTLANTNVVTCVMTSNATCATGSPATSNAITMTVNSNLPASVSIAAVPSGAICSGTSVTFTATPTNGGTTPTYSWRVNGTAVGTGSTYTSTTLANTDVVTCVMTSNATCATGSPATSNAITMTVNPNLPASVSIAAVPAGAICPGTSVTFTATPTNGGTTPTYSWRVNGTAVGTGTTYASTTLVNSDIITCVMTSNATCATGSPATSNAVTMIVNQAPSITSDPGNSTIGSGGNTSFSVTATGAGLTYQWQLSTDGGGSYNNITAAGTNPVYSNWTTATLGVSGVIAGNNGYRYRCIVSGTCAPSATSLGAILTVNNAPAITSHPSSVAVCAGLNTSFSVVASGTITGYQWQLSTDGGSSFNNISAAGTNPVYSNWTTATLNLTGVVVGNNAYQYRCVVTGPIPPDATSNAATLTVNTPPSIGTQPSPATLCEGTNTSFTVAATGTISGYQWQLSTDGGGTYNNITAAGTSPTYSGWTTATLGVTGVAASNNGYRYRCVVSGPCTPAATSTGVIMTVNPNVPASVSIAAVPAGAICAGTSVTFTATPTNGGTTPTYSWRVNGTAVGTGVSYTTTTLANTDIVTCVMTSNASCVTGSPATSNAITMTVNPNLPASVSIAAVPAGAICAGTSVTFTASPTNGGTTPTYSWRVNGTAVGTGTTLTSTTLANTDVVTCVMTSNATCATGSPATSNAITMVVNPSLAASVSIAAVPAGSICTGTSVTFTATPTNGGTTPTYSWRVNGTAVGTGSTYTSSTLSNLDAVTCVMTSNATCATGSPATSNVINMSVSSSLVASVSISAAPAGAICTGTSVTFTAVPTNGGTTPTYSWKINGTAVGTGSTYTSTTLSNSDVVTCVMTSNAGCVTGSPATSNAITMVVNTSLPASVSIAASPATTVCAGTNVTFTATPVNGGVTPSYQWYINGSPVGTNSATYSSTSLSSGNIVSCVMTSSTACASGSPATSNNIIMTINPNVPAMVSIAGSPSGTICAGTSVTFTATPINGGTTPTYQWYVNGVSVGTGSTYSSSALSNADAVTSVMTSNASCVTGNPATSNVINMSVNPSMPVSVSIAALPSTTICSGTNVTFNATPVNGGSSPIYQWYVNGSAVGTNSASFSTTTLTSGSNVSCILTSSEGCATASPATSNVITMVVNPNLPASVSIAASPSGAICAGTSVTFTASPTNGGSSPSYNWQVNGSSVGTGTTYTSSTLATSDVINCVMTSNATCATGSPATSNIIAMIVNPNVPASISIAASPAGAICTGTSVTFTASPVNGGSSPTYQWRVNGTGVGTGASYTSTTLTNGDVVSCVMTSNASCATGSPATSNSVTMSVNPSLPVGVSIAAVPSGSICSGTNVTFTATGTNAGSSPTYAWAVNGISAGSNMATFSSNTLANGDVVTCTLTSNLSCTSGNPATSNAISMTVTPSMPASVSISASPTGAICEGTPVNFTASPVNGGTTPSYQWMINSVVVSAGNTYTSSGIINGDVISCSMTSNLGCVTGSPATSNSLTMSVNSTAPVSASIIASPSGAVCPGTNVTFVAVATNGGSSPSYQWLVNGTPNGTTSMTFSSSSLNDADQVSCIVTSNASCAGGSPATSNIITMSVTPVVAAAVNISATPAGSICQGTPVTITATPSGGGTSPAYQWVMNGVVVGNGTSYSSSTFADNDQVICVMASNASCATGSPAISNPLIMDVNPILAVGVSISANPAGTVCSGTTVTFTANAIDAGANPTYQWKINGINVGGNSPTYTNGALSTGDIVSCTLTATAPCATGSPASSNVISMNIVPSVAVSVSIAASPSETICSGTSVTFTASPSNEGTTPTYQWLINGVYAGSGLTLTTSALANGDNVKCILTSSEICPSGSPATSNIINMVVNPSVVAGVSIVSDASATVCQGTLVTFTATPVNEGVSPSYQWMVNGLSVGSDNPIYSTTALANGDIVSCRLTSSEVCASNSPVLSNAITVVVSPTLPVSLTIEALPTNVICEGTEVTFSAVPTNSGLSPVYQWYLNGTAVGINTSTYTSSTLATGDVVNCVLTSSAVCAVGSPATSNSVTMTVNPVPIAEAGNAQTTCSNVPVVLGATGGDTYAWSIGEVGDTITVNPQTSTTYIVTVTTNGCSSYDFVDVLVLTAPTVDLGMDIILCGNQSITLNAGAGNQSYLWTNGSTGQTLIVDSTNFGLGAHAYGVDVTAFNGCHGTDTINVTLQSCAGIDDVADGFQIIFYPNPVHDVLTVSIEGELTEDIQISVLDVVGQITYKETIKAQSAKTQQIDLSAYPVGVYYLNVQTSERSYVHKLIVN